MEIRQLTLEDCDARAELLAACFVRSKGDMLKLCDWFDNGHDWIAYGAWDGARLAAQYSCMVADLILPRQEMPARVGICVNMAVHPDYRGRGLIKQASSPVYADLERMGVAAGVGFSNAEGVKVDRRSKGYGYVVLGRLIPTILWPIRPHGAEKLAVATTFPEISWREDWQNGNFIRFKRSLADVKHRYPAHPFRCYRFGWDPEGRVLGLAVACPMRIAGIPGAALYAAFSDDLPELLRRWVNTIWLDGARFVYLLSTPASPILAALRTLGLRFQLPYNRTPYYLTVKPLKPELASTLCDYAAWDCTGGDIL